jgi:hypothetical protein
MRMSMHRLEGNAAAALAVGLLLLQMPVAARAADQPAASTGNNGAAAQQSAQPQLSVAAPAAKAAPKAAQASKPVLQQQADAQASQPFNMGIDPFRAECETPSSTTAQNSAIPSLSTAPKSPLDFDHGAKFLPMFKAGDHMYDPQTKGNFVDRHEFGVQLVSHF